jgi:hypothetical protein
MKTICSLLKSKGLKVNDEIEYLESDLVLN